jgi:6-phosphofructokinase
MSIKALLIHSGGPSPVINASLAGLVQEARSCPKITQLYGARFGIEGILKDRLIDLFAESAGKIEAIGQTPASVLGTSRKDVDDKELELVLHVCRTRDIGLLFVNGGNGSLGMADRIATAAGGWLQVIGIPKTIDNDLVETDHTPGYPTAARFFACAARDIGEDNRSLPGQVEFIEVLGRNAGWLVAATSLARHEADDAPHLIYFPERRLPLEKLLDDINEVYQRLGRCVVAVCEGQLDEYGECFGADTRPGSRGKLAMNLAHRLAMLTAEKLKLKARSEKPGLLGRSFWSDEPRIDRAEARLCGQAAVSAALAGRTRVTITLVRELGAEYRVSTGLAPLENVASRERLFPSEWKNAAGTDVTAGFRKYAEPLVGSIAPYAKLV